MPSEAFRRHTERVLYHTEPVFYRKSASDSPPALSRFESDLPYKQASDGIIVN
ncbi:lacto-N-neotetraose biosynthesis glycosyl transferase LgtA [Neisseria meningitidis]|nr:hypothetical protein DE10444_0589 [Neisseria meningitidis]MBG8754235.1 lacto-N-neotetraose biosynthesis glycosyl transferase LgtA [Neisseria meningitidis]MBG8770195.1 lacto-N-neotetraose biosynthesis glycosyl transferase LgtA [Neisseria meningitidis]OOG96925.1 lacto-N-neotetraose biosynthesis glycosyl transferase LgtA [Neisseria meningitidis]OOG98220.1 lacto-N-neotetraose biosynthesis glycosyl transferase LgtA [Neisseria meningitidis]